MSSFRMTLKKIAERATGLRVERLTPRSFVFFPGRRKEDAWFSIRAQIQSLFETLRIDLVVDVGANEGQFGREVRRFYKGEILSFEPVAAAFERLSRTITNDPLWHAQKFALGSKETTQRINIAGQSEFSSLLQTNDYCEEKFGGGAVGTRNEMVSVRRLDNLLDELVPGADARRIFLKMDTQGYDLEVFRGAGNKLSNVVALQSEVSLIPIYKGMPRWIECIAAYEQEGFGVVGMYPVTRDSGRIIEYDCLLVRNRPA